MGGRWKERLWEYLRANALLFLIIGVCFVAGIIVGSLVVKGLSFEQQGDLSQYLEMFLQGLRTNPVDSRLLAQETVYNNLKIMFIIWFLGLTIIGLPVILAIIFTRGFVLGFTVGFLIQEKSTQGVVFTLISIIPPNLINIPVILMSGVAAVSFSLLLLRGPGMNRGMVGLPQQFVAYSLLLLGLSLTSGLVGILEAYLIPSLLKMIMVYVP